MPMVTADHDTPLGTMWSAWTARGLYSLHLGPPRGLDMDQRRGETEFCDAVMQTRISALDERLDAFFRTGRESFDDVVIDSRGWTEFASRVYECCRSISAATTVTYKDLAKLAGSEKASRAVGAAMARNRILLVIPCHRVISGGGQLRGFSAPGGLATKRRLLELERRGHWPADVFETEPKLRLQASN